MTDEDSGNRKSGLVNVNTEIKLPGEKVDEAASEILKQALRLPAAEASGIVSDLIGIAGDRLKIFRFENRVRSLQAAKERFEAKGLSLAQAKQISQGEVYDLLEGMGGADGAEIRQMWAGLMANAMDPEQDVNAEKGFIRVLEALGYRDAIIVEFLASCHSFELWLEQEQEAQIKKFAMARHDGDYQDLEAKKNGLQMKRKRLIEELKARFEDADIENIQKSQTSLLNLRRLGVLEAVSRRDTGGFQIHAQEIRNGDIRSIVEKIGRRFSKIESVTDLMEREVKEIVHFDPWGGIRLDVKLTGFGVEFAKACGLMDKSITDEVA